MSWVFWVPTIYFSVGFIKALQLYVELTTTTEGEENVNERYKDLQKYLKNRGLEYIPSKNWLVTASCLNMFFFWLPVLVFNLFKKRYED